VVTRLACPSCDTALEGRFGFHELLKLPEDDLAFITAFVRASGSLKQMAKVRGQSYPTIRNHLNEIINRLETLLNPRDDRQNKILDALARGELTVAEAGAKLKGV